MSTYRIFTTAFKRQVAQEYLAGASLNALGRKHEVARNLIRMWDAKYQAGEYEPDFIPMPRLSAHEVKIAELERMVGKLTMELEFLRGLMTQKEVLNFKPAPRLEQIGDKRSKQVDDRKHRIG